MSFPFDHHQLISWRLLGSSLMQWSYNHADLHSLMLVMPSSSRSCANWWGECVPVVGGLCWERIRRWCSCWRQDSLGWRNPDRCEIGYLCMLNVMYWQAGDRVTPFHYNVKKRAIMTSSEDESLWVKIWQCFRHLVFWNRFWSREPGLGDPTVGTVQCYPILSWSAPGCDLFTHIYPYFFP